LWFEAFFRANYGALCTFAVRYVDSPHEAEEIVQDAMLQLWLHRDEPVDAAVRTYAFTIVRNRCFDLLKKRRVRRRVMEQDAEAEFPSGATPESDFREGETLQAIEAAIDELPDRRREIFLMSRRDNLTYQEIATILSISIKTVETQMGRALRHLRLRLAHFTYS
jgi:RNA polymerase sigma-70 factor, ECF subfamily